jgi:hypothetical protein
MIFSEDVNYIQQKVSVSDQVEKTFTFIGLSCFREGRKRLHKIKFLQIKLWCLKWHFLKKYFIFF